ncbi:hypothetical protein EDF56_101703 [Novosphingobium sp. PhB165]|uniref:TraB/GumN family protein n=1 Tax=Novosphingobium sp. PhB165 TaxID=2485105 RepID=UPI001050E6C8|nr:TraB/GumN family protein [Novosphingobium sp. PhB165]TCM22023.1 hypothetical protein EDF56_101703 [Novosphingobium sp. PhB165]
MRILRKSRLRLLAAALGLCVAAPTLARDEAPARPAMWKIEDKDTTIYLFGTIHILPEDTHWFAGPVKKAFDSSDLLVTETLVDSPESLQKLFIEKGMRADGTTLRASLAPEERAAFEKAVAGMGLPAETFDPYEAWYAGLLLSLLPLKAAGYDKANGVETLIDAKAAEEHKARKTLETPEYQIELFDSMPVESQNRYLGEVLDQLPTLREDVTKVVAAWKSGRPNELAKLLNEDESDEAMRKAFITNRNQAWAKWLEARMAVPGTVFVAVGAGHLAGEGSVQDELAKVGIKATRVQ